MATKGSKSIVLSPKRARFVEEYLIDLVAAQAAVRAGYSARCAKVTANRMLADPLVQEAIAERQKARSERTQITADRVLSELAKIGFSDIRRAVKWRSNLVASPAGEDAEPLTFNEVALTDSDALDEETAGAIAEVSQTKDGALKVKLHDKQAALVSIGKHLGMFKEKVEHSGPDGAPIPIQVVISPDDAAL